MRTLELEMNLSARGRRFIIDIVLVIYSDTFRFHRKLTRTCEESGLGEAKTPDLA